MFLRGLAIPAPPVQALQLRRTRPFELHDRDPEKAMSRSGFTRELLREKGFVIVDGVATRVPPAPAPPAGAPPPATPARPAGTIRAVQHPKRMTKVEARFYEKLKQAHQNSDIIPQFRVRVSRWDAPSAVHYTADFAVFTCCPVTGRWTCDLWETKDSRRPQHSDEKIRPKMACEQNPWIREILLAKWTGSDWITSTLAENPTPTIHPSTQ